MAVDRLHEAILQKKIEIETCLKKELISGEFDVLLNGKNALGHIAIGISSHRTAYLRNPCERNLFAYHACCELFTLLVRCGADLDAYLHKKQKITISNFLDTHFTNELRHDPCKDSICALLSAPPKQPTPPPQEPGTQSEITVEAVYNRGRPTHAMRLLQELPRAERHQHLELMLHWAARNDFKGLQMLLETTTDQDPLDHLNRYRQTFIESLIQSEFTLEKKNEHMAFIINNYYRPFYLTAFIKAMAALKNTCPDQPFLFTVEQFRTLFAERLPAAQDWMTAIEYPLGGGNALAWAVAYGYYELVQALLACIPNVTIDTPCVQQAITAAKEHFTVPQEIADIVKYFQQKKHADRGEITEGWLERMGDFIALLVHITHNSRLYEPVPFDEWFKSNHYRIAREKLVTLYKAPSGSAADITLQIMGQKLQKLIESESTKSSVFDQELKPYIGKAYKTAMEHWEKNLSGDFQPLFTYFLRKFQPGHTRHLVDTKFFHFIEILKRINDSTAPAPRETVPEGQYQKLIQRIVTLLKGPDLRKELKRMYDGFLAMLGQLYAPPNTESEGAKAFDSHSLAYKILYDIDEVPKPASAPAEALDADSKSDDDDEGRREFARETSFRAFAERKPPQQSNSSVPPEKTAPPEPAAAPRTDDSDPDTFDDDDTLDTDRLFGVVKPPTTHHGP